MVSLAYNIGGTRFANSTLISDVNNGRGVPAQDFTRHDTGGGVFMQGLLNRREDEYGLFTEGGGP